jgi:hypothetical protein
MTMPVPIPVPMPMPMPMPMMPMPMPMSQDQCRWRMCCARATILSVAEHVFDTDAGADAEVDANEYFCPSKQSKDRKTMF